MVTRLQAGQVNTLLACLVNTKVRLAIPTWSEIQGTVIVVNFYDYLQSQCTENFHMFLANPLSNELSTNKYSISTQDFVIAKRYIEAVCHNTSLKNLESYHRVFHKVLKVFLVEMLAVQLVLYQLEGKPKGEPTRIVCTYPKVYLDESSLAPYEGSELNEILGSTENGILVKDFNPLYDWILAQQEDGDISEVLEEGLQLVIGLGTPIMQNLRFDELLGEACSSPGQMIKQVIAQLWLITRDICAFGGIDDKALLYL